MNYAELNETLERLNKAMWDLESAYIENDGECTEETEQMEALIADLKELLQGEGLNLLGEWLKAKEDRKATLKAEKDYIARQMEANDKTIEFIKANVGVVLCALGVEKTEKSSRGYSFARTTSTKTSVDKDILNGLFGAKIESIREEVGIPADVTITLGASVSLVADPEELPEYYIRTSTPSVRFTKPRAKREA